MCCMAAKVQLPPYIQLPEPLYSLIMNIHPEHDRFMNGIRKYNSCFQMTSFGAKQIVKDGFMPTFKVQGQVTIWLEVCFQHLKRNHSFYKYILLAKMIEKYN